MAIILNEISGTGQLTTESVVVRPHYRCRVGVGSQCCTFSLAQLRIGTGTGPFPVCTMYNAQYRCYGPALVHTSMLPLEHHPSQVRWSSGC
jgi:hypothetical protein